MDIAKRLIDYGFHPYTTAFPLIVPGALMIEPTESESRKRMRSIHRCHAAIAREAKPIPKWCTAPHSTRVGRLDEVGAAARKPVLRWKPA
jgi:glycine dehydrogenase subunit 2